MDREVALTLLTEKVAATSRPVLSPEAVGALLDSYAAEDATGRRPTDSLWEGTWDLNAAAAEGWRMKAGKVAGDFNFSADGASYSKADVLAHCLEMETKYASLCHGTMSTLTGRPTLPRDWDGNQVP
jgi:hypothetical protein